MLDRPDHTCKSESQLEQIPGKKKQTTHCSGPFQDSKVLIIVGTDNVNL